MNNQNDGYRLLPCVAARAQHWDINMILFLHCFLFTKYKKYSHVDNKNPVINR